MGLGKGEWFKAEEGYSRYSSGNTVRAGETSVTTRFCHYCRPLSAGLNLGRKGETGLAEKGLETV
jgi:hypothetical protein